MGEIECFDFLVPNTSSIVFNKHWLIFDISYTLNYFTTPIYFLFYFRDARVNRVNLGTARDTQDEQARWFVVSA